MCVVGVGGRGGLDPNLSMAYQSGFHPGSCFIFILMNEIWVSLWHFGIRFKLLFKDQCLVSYDQKLACSVGEYMQQSINADSI